MLRRFLAVGFLGLALSGCGSDTPTAPPPTPIDTRPARAVVTVTQNGGAQICISPLASFTYRMRVGFTIRETAGLQVSADGIRLSLMRGGTQIEAREIGSSTIVAAFGTNTIDALATKEWRTTFDFNADNWDTFAIRFFFTDGRGNKIEQSIGALSNVTVGLVCS